MGDACDTGAPFVALLMPPLEAMAALCSVINVALLARRSVWNFAFGLVTVALYGVVFFDARLYAVAGLQLVFFVAQIAGLNAWRHAPEIAGEIAIRALPFRLWAGVISGGAVLSMVLELALRQTDAAAPIMDGGIAGFSIVAQLLTNGRYVQSWPVWAAVNGVSILLYTGQQLWLTAGLSIVLLGIALAGWRHWAQQMTTPTP